MPSWSKGRKCGVDNCLSNLWTLLDGQKICQNGHIDTEQIEISNEVDTYESLGRKLTIKKKTKSIKEDHVFYSTDSVALITQILQLLLRRYIRFVASKTDNTVENEVRKLWAYILQFTDFANITVNNVETTHSNHPNRINILPVHLVALCYIACVNLQFDVYFCDFCWWLTHYEFPYVTKISNIVSDDVYKKIGPAQKERLSTYHIPGPGTLAEAIKTISGFLNTQPSNNISKTFNLAQTISGYSLIIKTVNRLLFPPEIYLASLRLFKQLEIDPSSLKLNWKNYGNRIHLFPDLLVTGIVVVTAKLAYWKHLRSQDLVPKSPFFHLWNSLILRLWDCPDKVSGRDVSLWSDSQIKSFLDFYQSKLLKETNLAEYKQLYQLFPLKDADPYIPPPIQDLVALINSVPPPSISTIPKSYELYKEQNSDDLPPLMKQLYEAASLHCGVKFETFVTAVNRIEKWCQKI